MWHSWRAVMELNLWCGF